MTPVTIAVEGPTDTAIAQRLLLHAGLAVGPVYEAGGKSKLDQKLAAYNNAARNAPWFVLRDMDQDASCAPLLVDRLLRTPARHMRLRIAVHQGESWLLADADRLAAFLQVRVEAVPHSPDTLANAKQALINLARASRSREIRSALVPPEGSTASVGRQYTSVMAEFARMHWHPGAAAKRSESLARCISALRALKR
ncbi:hypothetical protein [Stigmatella aurantiaca]|uniref:Conserved uncharacterized protein n=1 Tax=Stigmatella aurantiaca (strain DW4/3-1) TaxID=378806 RepID=E3FUR0_STIAD|nr:hypothetical protein [Stigmatella aurantiaca]ADO75943.1 conserved uncharacterized protein [Stigmatella aurantiaca DW4/3-1]